MLSKQTFATDCKKTSMKRPYLFTITKALFKAAKVKNTAHYSPFVIRIDEGQGLPVLMFSFDTEFNRASVYAVDGDFKVTFSFEALSAATLLKKLLRFRLINKFHYSRFCA